MVKQNEILADMHVHTNSSALGFSTLHEVLCGARRAGMQYVAITDTEEEVSKQHLDILSRVVSETEVKLIPGIEYSEGLRQVVGVASAYTIVGIHPTPSAVAANPSAAYYFNTWQNTVKAVKALGVAHLHKHLPSLLGESELVAFYGLAIHFIKETGLWVEVSPWTSEQERRALSHILTLLEKETEVEIVLGTGAKYCEEVGRFHEVLDLFNKYEIDPKRVINTNEEALSKLYTFLNVSKSAAVA